MIRGTKGQERTDTKDDTSSAPEDKVENKEDCSNELPAACLYTIHALRLLTVGNRVRKCKIIKVRIIKIHTLQRFTN